ncbi:hypothetical protein [Zeaxanthinibacter enoshimensis]|uniref:NIPSNAP protein n=1 Tax=Zeaxanthinibacter enoshimensis TaxID=392009 RepID=A0A4V3D3F5_9FLAO|nr:hypothetical protein [Zeaxanthinibacter enoshimensis]TDQ29394.1 hypothetical protein CLV82_2852 [Zeaxanthinibacter enoshimensis]
MRTPFRLLLALLFLSSTLMQGQSDADYQSFWVHEDHVKPAMVNKYENVNKKLVSELKAHNIQDEQWITTQTDDYRYLYVGQIDNMASLDRPVFASLAEKMGSDKMGSLFSEMNDYYDKHFDYVIHLDKKLTYMPEGINQTPEGQDFRKFYYVYTTPANRGKLAENFKKIKKLYQDKGSKVSYRVYRSGFGAPEDYFLVAIAAKDALSYEQQAVANRSLLGEEAKPLFDEMSQYMSGMEVVTGTMRSDLAYSPKQ